MSKWTLNGKLKLKFVRPEKTQRVYDAQTRKNANPGLHIGCGEGIYRKGGWVKKKMCTQLEPGTSGVLGKSQKLHHSHCFD